MRRRKVRFELGELFPVGMNASGAKQPVSRLLVSREPDQDTRAADPGVRKTRVEIDGTFVLRHRWLELARGA
jgi:hypothetical protein